MNTCQSPWPAVVSCGRPASIRLAHLDLCRSCWDRHRAVILPVPGTVLRRWLPGKGDDPAREQVRTVVEVELHRDGDPACVVYLVGRGAVRRVAWAREDHGRATWMDWALTAEVV